MIKISALRTQLRRAYVSPRKHTACTTELSRNWTGDSTHVFVFNNGHTAIIMTTTTLQWTPATAEVRLGACTSIVTEWVH
jgi:hypothetical protein